LQLKNSKKRNEQQKYIIFTLAGKQFGVNIKQTREILSCKELTLVPESPEYIAGLIDLRGMVVPVIDLQLRLNIKKEETSQNNNKEASQDKNRIIIIVELENLTAGMMVEEVKQIKELNGEEIENLPSLAQKIDREYIAGVGRTEEEELLMILGLESVLTREEMNQIQELEDNVVNE